MFFIKNKEINRPKADDFPHPRRFCDLYISDKYKEILFVPWGKVDNGMYAEVDNLIIDVWPCKFQDLQQNIENVLKRYLSKTAYVKGKWPSLDNSQAKSQKSFESDYIRIRLETDTSRSYSDGEVERIKVSAQPTALDNTYSLTGCGHLLNTQVAQIVLDIFEACSKIRNN